jgi:flagellar protein FliS
MSPAQAYASNLYGKLDKELGVACADPHRLIAMLFDAAISSIATAQAHMAGRRIAEKGRAVTRAIRIISEGLRASLDRGAGGELAERLDALYDYMERRLVEANARNDAAIFNEVIGLLNDLAAAWRKAAPTPPAAPAPGASVPGGLFTTRALAA